MFCECGFKTMIFLLSALQVIVGIAMMAAGIAVFTTFGDMKAFAEDIHTLVPASVLIAAGVLLLLLAGLGFFGAIKENKCALAIFFIAAGALFIMELVGACLAIAMRGDIGSSVESGFNDFIRQYNDSEAVQGEIDWIQETFRCCGSKNVSDWQEITYYVPLSCCKFNDPTISAENCTESYVLIEKTPGCASWLHDFINQNLDIIGGVGLAFAFIQLIALAGVLFLLCRRPEQYNAF